MEDESLWQQAIAYRDSAQYQKAREVFLHFVDDDEHAIMALYNVAFCADRLGDFQEAYTWYRKAQHQGDENAHCQLGRMNLWDVLFTDYTRSYVTSFFHFRDFASLAATSKAMRALFEDEIMRTNFLTSDARYAHDFRRFFACVAFSEQPAGVYLNYLMKVDSGPIEIHFRDSDHLREIVGETPHVQPGCGTFFSFVYDPDVREDQVFVADHPLRRRFFVLVVPERSSDLQKDSHSLPICIPRRSIKFQKFLASLEGGEDDFVTYIAPISSELTDLIQPFPKQQSNRILYIDPLCSTSGIYYGGMLNGPHKFSVRDDKSVAREADPRQRTTQGNIAARLERLGAFLSSDELTEGIETFLEFFAMSEGEESACDEGVD